MAKVESASIRNIAVVGHGGTGKTSLCESFLFVSGKTERLGKVDEGTSVFDSEPEEQKRRISISIAANYVEWEKCKINIIDTPGDANFFMETMNALRVAEGAVVLIDAVGGVEFQTEKVWAFTGDLSMPRLIFINKLDRERADFFKAMESVRSKLKVKPTICFLPMGKEDSFRGVIDLIHMKAVTFEDGRGKGKRTEIPADLLDDAKAYRETMVEDIAECDEALMEKYLEEGELGVEDLARGLRTAVLSGSVIPVTAGAATKSIGVSALLDMIAGYMPSPLDRGNIAGKHGTTGEEISRKPDPDAPFSALVFKTIADPYAGKLTLFRVFSGSITPDSIIGNTTKRVTEKFGNLFHLEGKQQRPTDEVVAGDIAAVAKLKEAATGDTFSDEKNPIVYDKLPQLPALVSFAIGPKAKGDEDKIISSLNRILEEDPTLSLRRDDETREIILSGMGQVHIEVTVEKLKRKFGVDVDLRSPKVPYKETIKGKTRVQGRYKKQSGGRGQYGDTWIEIEPLPRGQGFEFVDRIVGGVIPKQYIPAVEKGIVEAMAEGTVAGYPTVDVRVSLVDGSFHAVDSSEMAFKIAGSMGFKKGILQCQPTLLEPIVNIEIEISDEYLGDVIGNLNSRRGRVLGMDTRGRNQIVKGQVPLAEILTYAADLRSITSGRGTFRYEHSHYEEVPAPLAEKIIALAKKDKEEE
jgi:elongation factor G